MGKTEGTDSIKQNIIKVSAPMYPRETKVYPHEDLRGNFLNSIVHNSPRLETT